MGGKPRQKPEPFFDPTEPKEIDATGVKFWESVYSEEKFFDNQLEIHKGDLHLSFEVMQYDCCRAHEETVTKYLYREDAIRFARTILRMYAAYDDRDTIK